MEKAETTGADLAVPYSSEKGQPRIVTFSNYIQDQRRKELVMPKRLTTFDCMLEDDAVYNSVDVTNLYVTLALHSGEFVPRSGSQSSKIAAEFLNYCIRTMRHGTWLDAINSFTTDLTYGYSLANIVTERRTSGEFAGSYCLRKLGPRDQKSIAGWLWDKNFRELKGVVQNPSLKTRPGTKSGTFFGNIPLLNNGKYYDKVYPIMRMNQLLHFNFNGKSGNPQGDSPLNHCYSAYKEKLLVERYEVVGVSKDLGGALVLRVPPELIQRANKPTQYPEEAKEYAALQEDAAKLHAGESSYIVLTSEYNDSNKPVYDATFQGIEGGGKQYNTSDIINQKRKSIYNVFGTGFLLLGQDGVGSYSLSTDKTSTHAHYVERNLLQKGNVLETQLAPLMLAVNNISLSYKDMPKWVSGDPQEADLEVVSKFIQRTGQVDKLTPAVLEDLLKKAGLPTEGIEELDFTRQESGSGEGSMGTSGTGTSQAGGASSAINSDNTASANKSFILEEETDSTIVIQDTDTGDIFEVDK